MEMNSCSHMETLKHQNTSSYTEIPTNMCNSTDDAKLYKEINNNIDKHCCRNSVNSTFNNQQNSQQNILTLPDRLYSLGNKLRWIKNELVSTFIEQMHTLMCITVFVVTYLSLLV